MFRFTSTLLVIFLLLNPDHFALAWIFKRQNENDEIIVEKKEAPASEKSMEPHSRQKRGWGTVFSGLAAGSFAASVVATLYTQITHCKNEKPSPCKTASCQYIQCPNVCRTPDKNEEFLQSEKVVIAELLSEMDQTQLKAFNLAINSASASLSNEIILNEIDKINDKVDRLMYDMAQLDRNVSYEFANKSKEIEALLRDFRLSADEIVASGTVQGIFDKWTWEGTGIFVLSIALPIGIKGAQILRQRYVINKMYKEMKADFLQRVSANVQGSKAQAMTRDAWVKSLRQPKVDAQLKNSAKTLYYSQQAQGSPSKWTPRVNGALNAAVAALSIYSTVMTIQHCQDLANLLQDDALDIAEQHDEIEEVKQTLLDPLWIDVQKEGWAPVKDLLTNETTLDWLDGIRNLTLGAEQVNSTTANTIQYFMDNIEAADVQTTISLQSQLIEALQSVDYTYDCLSDKLHAITIVLSDCEVGRDTFEQLYEDVAVIKNELNRDDCVNDKMVPYTSIDEFRTILDAWADHQGWYSNCLLNSEDILYRVCNEYLKGYTEPSDIIIQMNKTDITTDMVNNFLTRCPDPKITPKAEEDTCFLYCLYLPVAAIAETVILKESQVEGIINNNTCPICDVRQDQVTDICNSYYCKSVNVTDIEEDVRLPSLTVQYVIVNNCSLKCIIDDPAVKISVCDDSKCKGISASEIAADLDYPESAINDVITECDSIVPSCGEVDTETKDNIYFFACTLGLTADVIKDRGIVDLPLAKIQSVIDEFGCQGA